MYTKKLCAGWADMDFNSHMKNTSYLDKTADVRVTAGYTQNVVGFGWTNGVYLKMRELLSADSSVGSCARRQAAAAATSPREAD